MSENLFWLSEEQFAGLKPLLPDKVGGVARVECDWPWPKAA